MSIHTFFKSLNSTPTRRRPAPCRLAVEALEDRCVPASLAVSDVALLEGNTGTQNAVVTVSLSAPTNKTVTVNYNTADGTARAGSDYNAVSGTLTFARGQTSKSILIPVIGDSLREVNETFFVNLNGAKNATIADGQGVVTIVDDDTQARISISDAWALESNANWGYGTSLVTFTVSLAAAYDEVVTVNYATEGFSGYYYIPADSLDYLATSETLTFAPGETTKTITVTITGTPNPEYNEIFLVNLSGASANALIIDGEGIGYIEGEWGNFEPGDPGNTY